MITGIRLTQLANGEPLLGTSWNYRNLSGVDAARMCLEDMFEIAQDMGFEFIIDTIKPTLNIDGELTLDNNGAYGDIWPFQERIAMYKQMCEQTGLNILLEIEFPTLVTDDNWKKYADYFLSLVNNYDWVPYWQIMTTPEVKNNNGEYKCSPVNYVRFMKYIYPIIKLQYTGIKVGGPGIYQGLIDYANRNTDPTDWLSTAIGDVYKISDTEYNDVSNNGFLPYIDFFVIQARQNLDSRLSYEVLPQIIDNLNVDLKAKTNRDIQIISTYQGRAASKTNPNSIIEQGYYDLREILNCIKKGIIPFKTQLVDEYNELSNDNDIYHMGLMEYYMGEDSKKASFAEYKYLLNSLQGFNRVVDTNQVVDNITNVDILTLMNTTEDKSATIIWPKHFEETTTTLQPHYARQYALSNGDKNSLVNPTQIVFNSNTGIRFAIVFQTINKTIVDIEKLELQVEKKLNHTETMLKHLVSLLPSTYNKEIIDVNFYKILRAIALELADAEIEIEKLQDNLYLDTAEEESIYNNFGTLINLSKKADWDYEKYRRLVKGVTKSLIDGPTNESIIEAVKLFTNFDVNLYELYKNYIHIDRGSLGNVKPQYAFIIEIEKPIEAQAEQESIYADANYVINIVKPAHTIHLVIVTLVGKENYRNQFKNKYGYDFSQSDKMKFDADVNNKEGIFGWKHIGYDGQFKTADVEKDDIFTGNNLTNGAIFIGPRYVLYDETSHHIEYNLFEKTNEIIEELTLQEFDVFNNEQFHDAIEEKNILYEQTFRELRFGFDYTTAFQNNISLLNHFKLCPTTKLKDELWSELELFLKDKYEFKSSVIYAELEMILNETILVNNINDEYNDYEIDGLKEIIPELIEGLYSELYNPNEDTYKFENDELYSELEPLLNETILVNNINDEYNDYDIDGLKEVVPECIENIYSELDAPPAIDNYDRKISESEERIVPLPEQYENVTEKISDVDLALSLEQYRSWTSDSWYHIHKKYTKIVDTNYQNEYYLPNGNLYSAAINTVTSSVKVFVNGMIQPYFNYSEIHSFFLPNKIMGIKFEEGIIKYGDIITIMYLWDQDIIVANFPIMDWVSSQIFFSQTETWKVIEKINDDKLHIQTYYKEEMQIVVNDNFNHQIEYILNEIYEENKLNEKVEIEISPYNDVVDWNNTTPRTSFFRIINPENKQTIITTISVTTVETGSINVIVTAFGMENSPKTVPVDVVINDTANDIAEKIRVALSNNLDINAFFIISSSDNTVILTTKVFADNDPTMNIEIAGGLGITATTSIDITNPENSVLTTSTLNNTILGGGNNQDKYEIELFRIENGEKTIIQRS